MSPAQGCRELGIQTGSGSGVYPREARLVAGGLVILMATVDPKQRYDDTPMTASPGNKQHKRSSQTRDTLIATAELLYASRGIDSVSLNEILAASGHRNRSAMQYHFGNREGLLQAIIDRHSQQVYALRAAFMDNVDTMACSGPALAARVFVQPIADYMDAETAGIHYVKILSQMTVQNTALIYGLEKAPITLTMDPRHRRIAADALSHLGKTEANRRTFLSVGMVFHSLADIYRLKDIANKPDELSDRRRMVEQVVCALQAYYAAPAWQ